jgi:hypothetical protein
MDMGEIILYSSFFIHKKKIIFYYLKLGSFCCKYLVNTCIPLNIGFFHLFDTKTWNSENTLRSVIMGQNVTNSKETVMIFDCITKIWC